MADVLALQLRRGKKVLQLLVLPYELNYDNATLLRMFHVDSPPHPEKGWRVVAGVGSPINLQFDGMEPYEADARMDEILRSAWVMSENRFTEFRGLVTLDSYDTADLRMDRLPTNLLQAVKNKFEEWA